MTPPTPPAHGKASRALLSLAVRSAITIFAFWWILRAVDLDGLSQTLRGANLFWMSIAVSLYLANQFICIVRWGLLVPRHPALKWTFLGESFFVAHFFNTFLPTTVGGDLIRGYDLIKATGDWRTSLASILMDRLLGFLGFFAFAAVGWAAFPPAREDPVIRSAFFSFCALVLVTFAVLGSRRVLQAMLRPFSKIGLGVLQSHAKQFQEALLGYLKHPKRLLRASSVSLAVQILAVLVFAAAAKALSLPVPLIFLVLIIPIVMTVSLLPISLNGWGIREGATVLFLGRMGIAAEKAFAFSLICAALPILSAMVGAVAFLLRRSRKAKQPRVQPSTDLEPSAEPHRQRIGNRSPPPRWWGQPLS